MWRARGRVPRSRRAQLREPSPEEADQLKADADRAAELAKEIFETFSK